MLSPLFKQLFWVMSNICSVCRDKVKEKERQKAIAEWDGQKKSNKANKKKTISIPWSNKVEKKVKRKIKREKKEIVQKKRKNEDVEQDDYNEIQKDFSLLKKLKKKKVIFEFEYFYCKTRFYFTLKQITEKEYEETIE